MSQCDLKFRLVTVAIPFWLNTAAVLWNVDFNALRVCETLVGRSMETMDTQKFNDHREV